MSGLRDELAALHRRYVLMSQMSLSTDIDGSRMTQDVPLSDIAALLDRFPPEAEGEFDGESPSKNGTYCSRRSPDRGVICTRELGHPGWHVGHLSEEGEVSQRWAPDVALAASPEEQDR